MKTRIGFVSNSSTTSFCIMGTYISKDEIPKELDYTQSNFWMRLLECEPNDYRFRIYRNPNNRSLYYIGFQKHEMREDETLEQFRQRVKEALDVELDGAEVKNKAIRWIEDSWYDG